MGDKEILSKAFRDLPNRVQNASIEERVEIFQNVTDVLSNPGITEQVIRGLCKVIQLTLPKYRDAQSQHLVKNLIVSLCKEHPVWAIKYMNIILKDIVSQNINEAPSKSSAQTGLYALGWSCLVFINTQSKSNIIEQNNKNDDENKDLISLIECQSKLLQIVLSAGLNKFNDIINTMFSQMHSSVENSLDLCTKIICKVDQGVNTLIYLSYLLKRSLQCNKNYEIWRKEYVDPHKNVLLETFIKNMIIVKAKPNASLISACGPLLQLFSENDFTAQMLPALQKSMLRNPEIIIECVGHIIDNVKIDTSTCLQDLGKHLIANLRSKEAVTRNESNATLKSLSLKCSKSEAIDILIKSTCSIYNGSDGKLTLTEHKISVLEAIGNLSLNAVSNNDLIKTTDYIIDFFIKVLDLEQNEKILCFALDMFSLWVLRLENEVPKKLVECFKKGLSSKSSNGQIRTSYCQMLLSSLENAKLPQESDLENVVIKVIEKSLVQSNQTAVISESLAASCLILKSLSGKYEQGKLNALWNSVLDMEKQVYFTEKFLQSATDDALYQVIILCRELLKFYKDRINGDINVLYDAITYACIHTNLASRQKCLKLVENILETSSNFRFCLLRQFSKYMENIKIDPDPRNLVDFLKTIFYNKEKLQICDAQKLCVESLICSHHPNIVSVEPELWSTLVYPTLPENLLAQYSKDIKNIFIEDYKAIPSYENALSTCVKLNPRVILPSLVKKVCEKLQDPTILYITRDEYFTYLTPEGEVYDKSSLPGNDEDEFNGLKNMKRESKVYSYKEQQEELQLRRELLEKKKREGKIPEMTPKQKEALRLQLEKEQIIRLRLQSIQSEIFLIESIIKACICGNPKEFSIYYSSLITDLLRNLQSPLAASSFVKLYVNMGKGVFEDNHEKDNKNIINLGGSIAKATIRLYEPNCDLDSDFNTDKDISSQIKDVIRILHDITMKSRQESNIENEYNNTYSTLLTAPQFSYCFPFIAKTVLLETTKKDDQLAHDILQIISEHAKMRGKEYHRPKYLPRKLLLELLIEVIATTTGRIQAQAVSTLINVAAACLHTCEGDEGDNINNSVGTDQSEEIQVLLTALQQPVDAVRDAGLRSIEILLHRLPKLEEDYDTAMRIVKRLWIACFDSHEENAQLASRLWTLSGYDTPLALCDAVLEDVTHNNVCVQQASAKALAELLKLSGGQQSEVVTEVTEKLLKVYEEKLKMVPAKKDQFDRIIEQPIDTWQPRRGVALACTQLAPLLDSESVTKVMDFYVSTGLGDRKNTVQKEMLNAALGAVEHHGKQAVSNLLPVFEKFLDKAPKSGSYDVKRQAVVILMGSLARHLDKDDPRIKPIVMRLIAALNTPSQQVQESVANCLPHLVGSVKEDAGNIIQKLLHQLQKAEKYGDRKGAAYGLAGMVKGLGILSLKQYDIMNTLTVAIQEKKNYKYREGALFAFEMLCATLGRLFEPYIVHVLPHLLSCFGDSSQYVRAATDDTARQVMSKLSAHGVKLVLPALLAALEEDSWRTKTGSVELLGAMAYCAPKQLSSCLPSIVPKLIEVLSDSHIKVQEAGAEALKVIGSVIRNPEIQAIVPVLLQALQDPSNKTSVCLQTLLDTQFVHFIDAPSLALVMPVVQRAFLDRSTETRKMAAQIIGNMYSLTDQKDLTPYLPNIIPGLKTSLLDPVPEVRSVSSRALGAMVRGMGEASFEDLLPWLMQTLTSETSSVDRSGAAQGLSEVVGGLGVEKLHRLMPEIIATAERTDIAPHVKDGYIMMFIYMPNAFPTEFTPYIGQIINPILKALADENEYVRDTALKAGQRIVNLYADSAIMLLLPELERGLFDDNWRIRYSSVQLLGDLLYRVSGVSGKMSTETASEDDNFGTEQSHAAIITALGADRRNRVLAGLYMGRSDVALMVRQAALHVWKVVVTNTPRTLREILPTLFGLLLGCLASTSHDKRQVAARTLGDLVRKLGERVLPEIIPILEKGLNSDQPDQRQGVCIGLSEIMSSTSRDTVLTFAHSLVPTVRRALCDPLPEVRRAAAKTFDGLHATVGPRALDDVLPSMLEDLNNPDPELAASSLDGLRQVMAVKSRAVLPYLIPQLTARPANTKALGALAAAAAGDALARHLHKILPALIEALCDARNEGRETQELEYCQAVMLAVNDETGIRTVMDSLMDSTKSEQTEIRRASVTLLCAFCSQSRADYSQYVPQLLRGLLRLFTDSDKDVLIRSWEALNAVTKTLDSEQQIAHVSDVRQAVRFASSDLAPGELLPGFCLPKGVAPILPIFREAVLNGMPDAKESASQGLGEIIKLTSASALQPSVVHITGPLIRILGDRFNADVKAAVLETLAILLAKVGVMLKQFLPQLQTTFLKSLSDANKVVRIKAGHALSHLIVIHTRADPVFVEIHNGIKNSQEDPAVRETMLQALRGVTCPCGDKMSDPVRKQITQTLIGLLEQNYSPSEECVRNRAAGCLGSVCGFLEPQKLDEVLTEHILVEDMAARPENELAARVSALAVAIKERPISILTEVYEVRTMRFLASALASDKAQVVCSAIRACAYLFQHLMIQEKDCKLPQQLLTPFVRTMNHASNDVKQLLGRASVYLSKSVVVDNTSHDLIRALVPALVNGTKEKNGYVKANSELGLVAILRLRHGDDVHKRYSALLDLGARESLNDVVSKVLRKTILLPEGKEDELDDTLIS